MEKINRFCAKHNIAVYTVSCILWIGLYCLLVQKAGIGLLVFSVGMVCISAGWINTRYIILLKRPVQILNETCDPDPYLEELQRQRDYSGPWTLKYNRTIYEATALVIVGQPEEAYRLLSPLQERLFKSRFIYMQIGYCGSMISVCRALDRAYGVENWHEKYMELYHKMKNNRQKQMVAETQPLYLAQYYTFRREHERAMEILQHVEAKNLYDQVLIAMICARNYLPMGELEKARDALAFVAEKGNKLYIATQARQMLSEMEETTPA